MEFMSQKDLMILAREKDLKGRSKMRKDDLMKALLDDELERERERKAWREEEKRRRAGKKAELKKERKEVKRGRKEDREKKLMRTKSEIKTSKRERVGLQQKGKEEKAEQKTKASQRQTKHKKNKERKEREIIDSDMKLKPHAKLSHKDKVKTRSTLSRPSPPQAWLPEVIQSKSSLKSFARQYTYEGLHGVWPREFLEMHKKYIIDILEYHSGTKVKILLKCLMGKRVLKTGERVEKEAVFRSRMEVNLEGDNKEDIFQRASGKIMEDMATFTSSGSGWRFERVIVLEIHLADYVPLKGNSYIPLPKVLKGKKAIINMKNEDDECFKWCITRALNPVESHPERITQELRRQSKDLDWTKIEFPVELDKIRKFESSNEDIGVNVLGYEKGVYPLRISVPLEKEKTSGWMNIPTHIVNLLLIEEDGIKHYCLIKNISRLLSSQVSKHKESKVFCLWCLNHFPNEEKLKIHAEYCWNNECVRLTLLPVKKDGSAPLLRFKNYVRKMRVPFMVYADFEALTEKISTCEPDPGNSHTYQYQKHKPCGFAYQIVCFDEEVYSQEPVIYRTKDEDEDVSRIFVDMLEENMKKIHEELDFSKKMIFTRNDKRKFSASTQCWICEGLLGNDKVRDHCHFTGKYRGAAHNKCNLQFQKPKFTTVVFHNLSGYDSHLFVKNLGKSEGDIKCIQNNEEKYISFSKDIIVGTHVDKDGEEKQTKHELRFIDSAKFMASSLDALVSNLVKGGADKLKQTKKTFNHQGPEKIELLTRKGVYPYDYMDEVGKFDEKNLPPKQDFYNRLNDSHVSDEDYEHAKKVWKEFGCESMGVYHDLYLKTDVLLLADVFEEFRKVCLENYELDPAWYYTAPGLAWDAALKLTRVKLELLTDVDMLLMFEKGIRDIASLWKG